MQGARLTGLNSAVAASYGFRFELEAEVVRAQAGVPVPLKPGRRFCCVTTWALGTGALQRGGTSQKSRQDASATGEGGGGRRGDQASKERSPELC